MDVIRGLYGCASCVVCSCTSVNWVVPVILRVFVRLCMCLHRSSCLFFACCSFWHELYMVEQMVFRLLLVLHSFCMCLKGWSLSFVFIACVLHGSKVCVFCCLVVHMLYDGSKLAAWLAGWLTGYPLGWLAA